MVEQKTITAREIKQIASTFYEQPKYIMWHGKRIKINPLLSFKEFFELSCAIISGCTKSQDNVLVPESIDFVFKARTIEKYGNIDLPHDIDDQYKIIYGSDIVEYIFKEVNQKQLHALSEIIHGYTGINVL